jgi:predicted RND superfamily exporter protein
LTPSAAIPGALARALGAFVDASGRRPWVVLLAALGVAVATWHMALPVLRNPRTDLRELLPTDSPGLEAFEHQLGRVGGGATLIVVVQSPTKDDSERFVDALADRLQGGADPAVTRLVAYVEGGTKDVHAFFEQRKWLYADLHDIDEAYDALDAHIAIRSGMVSDLDGAASPSGGPSATRAPALGLGRYEAAWKAREADLDPFPSGYFETDGGRMAGLRIVSRTTGMGDAGGDELLDALGRIVRETRAALHGPPVEVGFAGDIPNAVAEKDSVVGEAAWAGAAAFALVVLGVVWFYRSAWALLILAVPALVGVGVAYAFASLRFGYVNTTGMFLGAIILGNGINYPIVLLSRYREFVSRGMCPVDARREAVANALRAELVGACVASIAYGSLTVTQFRGFTQFGWIGLVGMLSVWVAMVPCVPAMLAIVDPGGTAWATDRPRASRVPGWLRAVGRSAERAPAAVVAIAFAATALAAVPVRAFLRDPWEYNFDHLGSRESKHGGAGEWSNKAEAVFGGKMNVAGALMLADAPEQVAEVKAAILGNDARDPQGSLIAGVTTIEDFLPGAPALQERKLAALARIRGRLTPAVLDSLDDDERARVAALRPPETLQVVRPEDLPALLRRRFEETSGRLGTVFYVKYRNDVSLSDGRNLLRIARATDDVRLGDGTVVQTASRSTIFAEMIRSMERDGPRATAASLLGVALVALVATRNVRGAAVVLASLGMAVAWLVGGAALLGEKLNYVNFVTLPITFGIGCEYPFNVYDRSRLLAGDVGGALARVGGAVALCSFTTMVGYGSLVFADFQALQSFGRLAVCGEMACLTGALVVVPALLRWRSARLE